MLAENDILEYMQSPRLWAKMAKNARFEQILEMSQNFLEHFRN